MQSSRKKFGAKTRGLRQNFAVVVVRANSGPLFPQALANQSQNKAVAKPTAALPLYFHFYWLSKRNHFSLLLKRTLCINDSHFYFAYLRECSSTFLMGRPCKYQTYAERYAADLAQRRRRRIAKQKQHCWIVSIPSASQPIGPSTKTHGNKRSVQRMPTETILFDKHARDPRIYQTGKHFRRSKVLSLYRLSIQLQIFLWRDLHGRPWPGGKVQQL